MRRYRRRRLQIRVDRRVHPHDMLASLPLTAAIYWLPIIAIVATGMLGVDYDLRTGVWTGCYLLMATASAVNWIRCGRLQSYWLTPLFLVGALASLTYGIGLLPLGKAGWGIIGYGMLAGLSIITFLPELFLGRYR